MNTLAFLMFQSDTASAPSSAAATGMGMGMMIVFAIIALFLIAAMWKVFEKAGEPGWAAIIPIYNIIILLKIAGKPAWWVILFIVPVVNFIIAILVALAIAKNFGKGTGFGLGLAFLGFIFYPVLAWGDARYQGQQAA
jgi:ABC-type sulfate transport system permease subunit